MSLKHRSQFSTTLDNELLVKLKELSIESGIPTSKLMDRAVQLLLKDFEGKMLFKINAKDE